MNYICKKLKSSILSAIFHKIFIFFGIIFSCILGLISGRDFAIRFADYEMRQIGFEIIDRSKKIGAEFSSAIKVLKSTDEKNLCDASHINKMLELSSLSRNINSYGYISNGNLICSSYGIHNFNLPQKSTPSKSGFILIGDIKMPFDKRDKYFLSIDTFSGYAAIILPGGASDLWNEMKGVGYYFFEHESSSPIFSREALIKQKDSNKLFNYFFSDREYLFTVKNYPHRIKIKMQSWQVIDIFYKYGIAISAFTSALIFFIFNLVVKIIFRPPNYSRIISQALNKNELILLFQPIVRLNDGVCIGAEALLRWKNKNGDLISPGVFQSAFDDANTSAQVAFFVAESALNTLKNNPDFGEISINFSTHDISNKNLIIKIKEIFEEAGINPSLLTIEITEHFELEMIEYKSNVENLRNFGFRIALDDFGVGHSNLSRVFSLPVDKIKIDKIFIDSINFDKNNKMLINKVVEIANDYQLEVIAEGVEDKSQAETLNNIGISLAQGWLYSKPLSLEKYLVYKKITQIEKYVINT